MDIGGIYGKGDLGWGSSVRMPSECKTRQMLTSRRVGV